MLGVILTAHGRSASGVLSGIEMVAGPSDNVVAVDFVTENQSDFPEIIKNKINEFADKYDEIVVVCDLAGGTPFNQSVINSQGKNVKVLAGLNFQLAYELIFSEDNAETSVERALESGKEGIILYKVNDTEENSSKDGI